MIVADSSVWIDHLYRNDAKLEALLNSNRVWMHPFVIGEVALGSLRHRHAVISTLESLPQCVVANHDEVMHLVEQYKIFSRGIGYVDAHLLAAVRLTDGASLWTRDKRLQTVAERLSLAAKP